MNPVEILAARARAAQKSLGLADTAAKNATLLTLAQSLEAQRDHLLAANAEDLAAASALSPAMRDRLCLTPARFAAMVDGVRRIAAFPDLVGEITQMRPNARGLTIGRMRVPLGVIGMIYESRPNVTIDAAALCLKSGNAVVLRGGSEAQRSNRALVQLVRQSLAACGLDPEAVQFIDDCDRARVTELLHAAALVDVVIPRGGRGLVELVAREARMPVIKHLDGVCHTYVDRDADLEKAWAVVENAKTYRYGICGATETLLVHRELAARFLPEMGARFQRHGVEMRCCPEAQQWLPTGKAATAEDFGREFLAAVIAIKIVRDYDDACAHIARYGSGHTDAIVSENLATAMRFLREVDSASVMVNTPTCFADGYEYGLGGEIGISTDKIHWRGPVGLEGLCAQKFIVLSDGKLR